MDWGLLTLARRYGKLGSRETWISSFSSESVGKLKRLHTDCRWALSWAPQQHTTSLPYLLWTPYSTVPAALHLLTAPVLYPYFAGLVQILGAIIMGACQPFAFRRPP